MPARRRPRSAPVHLSRFQLSQRVGVVCRHGLLRGCGLARSCPCRDPVRGYLVRHGRPVPPALRRETSPTSSRSTASRPGAVSRSGDYKGSTGAGGQVRSDRHPTAVASGAPSRRRSRPTRRTHQDVYLRMSRARAVVHAPRSATTTTAATTTSRPWCPDQTARRGPSEAPLLPAGLGHRGRRVQPARGRLVHRQLCEAGGQRDRHRRTTTTGCSRSTPAARGPRPWRPSRQRRDRGQPGRRPQRRVVHLRRDLHCRRLLQRPGRTDASRPLINTVNGATITATEGPQPADAASGPNMNAGSTASRACPGPIAPPSATTTTARNRGIPWP